VSEEEIFCELTTESNTLATREVIIPTPKNNLAKATTDGPNSS